ncbi:MAG: Holliday junction branch migration protein RuvA [Candidatus Paceibacterota bacterium]|jgi:Holliday junction DNA helicase RuvA
MISFLAGKIIYKDDKKVILDKGGIGFEIFLATNNLDKMEIGDETMIFTFLFLGEKIIELYGFLNEKEMELFKILKNVSGVGPKTAMHLAVSGSIEKLKQALEKGEMPPEAKGVGAKKLQKILLELTGKIEEIKKKNPKLKSGDETYEALSALGFSKNEIINALSCVDPETKESEEKLKQALRFLAK